MKNKSKRLSNKYQNHILYNVVFYRSNLFIMEIIQILMKYLNVIN